MRGLGLICAMGIAGCASAASAQSASNDLLTPKFTIDGSLPFFFNSNPAQDKTDPRPGNLFSPYVQLAASGSLRDNFGYLLYANTNSDKSLTRLTSDADDSQAAIGATLSRRWGAFSIHVTAERGYYFDRIYEAVDRAVNNFNFTARYAHASDDRNFWIRPSISTGTRLDDNFAALRYSLSAYADFERRIKGPLWFVMTPRVRYYLYQQGFDDGRRDTIGSFRPAFAIRSTTM